MSVCILCVASRRSTLLVAAHLLPIGFWRASHLFSVYHVVIFQWPFQFTFAMLTLLLLLFREIAGALIYTKTRFPRRSVIAIGASICASACTGVHSLAHLPQNARKVIGSRTPEKVIAVWERHCSCPDLDYVS